VGATYLESRAFRSTLLSVQFVSAWRRRVLSAAGAGAAVPALIIVAALSVGVGGGGLGGLGALSQAFTGPDIPDAEAAGLPGRDSARDRDPSRLLASAERATERRAATPDAPTDPGAGGGGPDGGGGGGRSDTPAAPPAATPTPPAVTPPATSPPPDEPPSVVRQVGDQVTQVVRPIPVVGETTGDVVDTLIDTVDALPPPLPLPD
jgi:hypothetical protein